jgi:hypothetical protein
MKRLILPLILLMVLLFAGTSEAQSSSSKQIGRPVTKTRIDTSDQDHFPQPPRKQPLGAPSNLRFKLDYTDYRTANIELKWHDNSSAETDFAFIMMSSSCITLGNILMKTFPANTTSGTVENLGIGLLNGAHNLGASPRCPREFAIVARDATVHVEVPFEGPFPVSNIIVPEPDTPNAPYDLLYWNAHGQYISWKYDKKYPTDNTGQLCFRADGIGLMCVTQCWWCFDNGTGFGFYTPGGGVGRYIAHLPQGGPGVRLPPLGTEAPMCTRITTELRTDGGPSAGFIFPSKPSKEICRRPPIPGE